MTSVIVFLWENSVEQIAAAFLVTGASLVLYTTVQPFANPIIQWMQGISLTAQAVTLFYGILVEVGNLRNLELSQDGLAKEEVALRVMIFALNILVFLVPIGAIIWAKLKKEHWTWAPWLGPDDFGYWKRGRGAAQSKPQNQISGRPLQHPDRSATAYPLDNPDYPDAYYPSAHLSHPLDIPADEIPSQVATGSLLQAESGLEGVTAIQPLGQNDFEDSEALDPVNDAGVEVVVDDGPEVSLSLGASCPGRPECLEPSASSPQQESSTRRPQAPEVAGTGNQGEEREPKAGPEPGTSATALRQNLGIEVPED
eukprot:CAMPEP_0184292762 /NCGR_PEP_ID=MMETSP1049-20130417/4469_1 /TAXON_ID=77928 /ORGANISM="Proteomonas sulcata, Strain CCMP704" /LENGTH=311 /DNA_ID=CAMNT_0026600649 /DNA_START=21 /DNA_END=956 /DNA_ORIENTATION=-